MKSDPLISCLCITKYRTRFLKRAIDCFLHQSYLNKELIIVYPEEDKETEFFIMANQHPLIRSVKVKDTSKKSLGRLRNMSIDTADGEFFCVWDDDDWYHKDRLQFQMNAIRLHKKEACGLAFWLMYDAVKNDAYFSTPMILPGSILCAKSVINEQVCYGDINRGEDLEFSSLLIGRNYLCPLIMPSLYIYVYNGNNTWDKGHFNRLFSPFLRLSVEAGELIGNVLSSKYDQDESSDLMLSQQLLQEFNFFHLQMPVQV